MLSWISCGHCSIFLGRASIFWYFTHHPQRVGDMMQALVILLKRQTFLLRIG